MANYLQFLPNSSMFSDYQNQIQAAMEKARVYCLPKDQDRWEFNEVKARFNQWTVSIRIVLENLVKAKEDVKDNDSFRVIKEIEDPDLDLIGSLSLAILRTKEVAIDFLGTTMPLNNVKESVQKGYYFIVQNLTVSEWRNLNFYQSADGTLANLVKERGIFQGISDWCSLAYQCENLKRKVEVIYAQDYSPEFALKPATPLSWIESLSFVSQFVGNRLRDQYKYYIRFSSLEESIKQFFSRFKRD